MADKMSRFKANDYVIKENVVVIFLTRKGEILECLADAEDLAKIINHGHWYPTPRKGRDGTIKGFAAYSDGEHKKNRILMHRLVTNCPSNLQVDHINANPLDNRKSNLRICTDAQNKQNYTKARKDSKTKILGVSWDNARSKWRADVSLNGKSILHKRFDKIEDAITAVRLTRKKYMPYSQEAL